MPGDELSVVSTTIFKILQNKRCCGCNSTHGTKAKWVKGFELNKEGAHYARDYFNNPHVACGDFCCN